MKIVERLKVTLNLKGKELPVGELARDGRKIYFKYYIEFLETKIEISPFKMPLSTEILSANTTIFEGLFGVFNDSLPDGWGRLILDRSLLSKGISLHEITPLDRLTYVGSDGVGALTYEPVINMDLNDFEHLELDLIAKETEKVLEGTSTDIIEELVYLGGSSGGARPKIFVGYNKTNDRLILGNHKLPEDYEPWLIKFPSSTDPKDIAQIEYAYYKMAIKAGLEMSECRLFKGVSDRQYFGTKRFDRDKRKRLHQHSAAGLMHDNFRLSSMDYGHLMDAAFRLEKHVGAYEKVFRLAAFNAFAHNRDDHSKNVSFLMNQNGEWCLAPAYDLTFSFSSTGYHSMTIAGEGKSPGKKHLMELANTFGVTNPHQIIDQVLDVTNDWMTYAKDCDVSKMSSELIGKTINALKI